jgi:hypothetical protein
MRADRREGVSGSPILLAALTQTSFKGGLRVDWSWGILLALLGGKLHTASLLHWDHLLSHCISFH